MSRARLHRQQQHGSPAPGHRESAARGEVPGSPSDGVQSAGALERLIFLSDGVFAIAMTLLVFELAIPEVTAGTAGPDLALRLVQLRPKYLSFAISFLVIASYWSSHQRIFQHIVRADTWLVWLNLALLLCIAFQPFPTSVLGSYGDDPTSVSFYAATLVITGVLVLALWVYATAGHRLVRPNLSPRLVRHHLLRALVVPVVFLVSIAIAQTNPVAAEFSWVSVGVAIALLNVINRRSG